VNSRGRHQDAADADAQVDHADDDGAIEIEQKAS